MSAMLSNSGLFLVEGALPAPATNCVELAQAFAVNDAASRMEADSRMQKLATEIDELKAHHDPICAARHEAWKEATGARKEAIEPRETAKKLYGGKVAEFDLAEKKRLEAEQQRLMREEHERAIAEREATIEHLEASGASVEEIQAACDAAVIVAPVVIATAPVVKGAVTSRFVQKGRVTSMLALVRHIGKEGNEHLTELLTVDEGKLNKMIQATAGKMQLPGVEVYQEAVTSTRRGK